MKKHKPPNGYAVMAGYAVGMAIIALTWFVTIGWAGTGIPPWRLFDR